MTTIDPQVPGGGNTKTPPSKKVKQISPAKKWIFVYNNPIEDWKEVIVPKFQSSGLFGLQPEVGASGTFHLQGWCEFNEKIRPSSLGLPKEIHWEKMKGSVDESIAYCSKSDTKAGDYITNKKEKRQLPEIKIYGWQLRAVEWLKREPNIRDILWIWSEAGARGKTTFTRHMVQNMGAIVCGGRPCDMKHQIVKYNEKHDDYPELVVFDVPRSMRRIQYTGLEEIKAACFASSKYESDMVLMPYCHMVVLANFPPDLNDLDMSHDRFTVWNVDQDNDDDDEVMLM